MPATPRPHVSRSARQLRVAVSAAAPRPANDDVAPFSARIGRPQVVAVALVAVAGLCLLLLLGLVD